MCEEFPQAIDKERVKYDVTSVLSRRNQLLEQTMWRMYNRIREGDMERRIRRAKALSNYGRTEIWAHNQGTSKTNILLTK